MATQVQFRRGNSTQVAAFTGAVGEIVVNTTNDSVHVNDGATQGGFELARVDGSNWNITNNITTTGSITGTTATFTTAGNTAQLVLKSTDDDASVGPRLDLTRDSASPADGDAAGQIRFMADNDAGTETSFGFVRMLLTDVSDGAEDGQFEIDTRVNGTNRNRLNMTSTETVFNEDSINLDFRVESNNTQGMFIVDAGDDEVKVGGITGSASGTLKVKSNSLHHAIMLEENSGNESYSLGVEADGSLIFANSGTTAFRFNDSGRVSILNNTDISMTSGGAGQLNIEGNGYDGAIALDATGMHIYHNSAARALILGTNETARMTIHTNGIVTIAKTAITAQGEGIELRQDQIIIGKTTSGTINGIFFAHDTSYVGGLNYTDTATSLATSSDERLKENIEDADDAGSKIDAMQVRKFDWKLNGSHQQYGFVAQELEPVFSHAVHTGADEMQTKGVDYGCLVPMLVKEIQSLRARVAQLETKG